MSTQITVERLSVRDVFELPSGSIYELARQSTAEEPAQALLWCSHPTDPGAVDSPRVALLPHDTVGLLSPAETRLHVGHSGYARTVFAQNMDRHHQERMQAVNATRADAAARLQENARRPWWQRLFR